ncbi:MAG: IS21 family transposase [Planctomycetota bacterium]
MKRLEIQTLRGVGMLVELVAAHTGASPRSVQRVAKEPPITDPAAVDDMASRRLGRPSPVAQYEPTITGWLAEDPKLPSNHVLERLRDQGYEGSKTAVYDLVRRLRPAAPQHGVSRFEGLPAEFSQHDFGEVMVRYRSGERERIQFFASVLKFSRLRRVELVANQTTESICHALVDAFTSFGGLPLIAVFDNPKTIVLRRDGNRVVWNPTFAHFCAESGIVPNVTWPYRPQEKGAVENLPGFVQSRNHPDKKKSNKDWESPTVPDARITKMKDGRTHLGHEAQHAIDVDTEIVVATTIHHADQPDSEVVKEAVAQTTGVMFSADGGEHFHEVVADEG